MRRLAAGQVSPSHEETKNLIRGALGKSYDVQDFMHQTGIAVKIARSKRFETSEYVVTGIMMVWFAIDADFNAAESLKDANPVFQAFWLLFFVFFAFHFAIKFAAFKVKGNIAKDSWMVFDMMLVGLLAAAIILGYSGTKAINPYAVLNLQLARVSKLLGAVPELSILCKGLFVAARSLFFTFLLMLMNTYVFGVIMTSMMRNTSLAEHYFKSVPESMHTLMARAIFCSDIHEFLDALKNEKAMAEIMVLLFTLISLALVVLFAGITCEVVSTVAKSAKEALVLAYVCQVLQPEFLAVDGDEDGAITAGEFLQLCERPSVCRTLSEMEVDIFALIDMTDVIFNETSGEHLRYEEFMEICMSFRENSTAKIKDLLELRKCIAMKRPSSQGGPALTFEDVKKAVKEAIESSPALSNSNNQPTVLGGIL